MNSRQKKPRTLGRTPGANRKSSWTLGDSLPVPERCAGRLPLLFKSKPSSKGSLGLLTLLQGRDHTRLQAPFDDLQVTMQAVDQIDEQALFL